MLQDGIRARSMLDQDDTRARSMLGTEAEPEAGVFLRVTASGRVTPARARFTLMEVVEVFLMRMSAECKWSRLAPQLGGRHWSG